MSNPQQEDSHPFGKFLGIAVVVAVPVALIFMFGIVGAKFLFGVGPDVEEPAESETVAAAPAPAPAETPAPAKGAADADTPAKPAEEPSGQVGSDAAAGGDGAPDPAQMKLGQTTYAACAACHGPDGKGLQAGPKLMAPSLVGSEVLLGDPDQPLLVVLKGIAKEDMEYLGQMLPLAAGLDDEKLAAVLTYTRNSWSNSAPPVTVEQAAAARAKFGDVEAAMGVKRDEIGAIVEAHK